MYVTTMSLYKRHYIPVLGHHTPILAYMVIRVELASEATFRVENSFAGEHGGGGESRSAVGCTVKGETTGVDPAGGLLLVSSLAVPNAVAPSCFLPSSSSILVKTERLAVRSA